MPNDDQLDPLQIIGMYLIQHATQVCSGTCLLCVDARAYLDRQGAVPAEVTRVHESRR